MEAVIFVGLQASGKSSFYKARFFNTHVRLNLDMLKTRYREALLLRACIEMKQPFVVDNTNPTVETRARYIAAAREAGFRIVGYYFQAQVKECIKRNSERVGREQIPIAAIMGTSRKLQVPSLAEGFDDLYYVRIDDSGTFVVRSLEHEA